MANDNKGLTPMMRQFFEMKSKHPEALLLFRCGDFYETYCEDAIEASKVLGITLTRRNNGGSAGGGRDGWIPSSCTRHLLAETHQGWQACCGLFHR